MNVPSNIANLTPHKLQFTFQQLTHYLKYTENICHYHYNICNSGVKMIDLYDLFLKKYIMRLLDIFQSII